MLISSLSMRPAIRDGLRIVFGRFPAPPAGSPLNLWMPVAKLTRDPYSDRARHSRLYSRTEIARYTFQLQMQ